MLRAAHNALCKMGLLHVLPLKTRSVVGLRDGCIRESLMHGNPQSVNPLKQQQPSFSHDLKAYFKSLSNMANGMLPTPGHLWWA